MNNMNNMKDWKAQLRDKAVLLSDLERKVDLASTTAMAEPTIENREVLENLRGIAFIDYGTVVSFFEREMQVAIDEEVRKILVDERERDRKLFERLRIRAKTQGKTIDEIRRSFDAEVATLPRGGREIREKGSEQAERKWYSESVFLSVVESIIAEHQHYTCDLCGMPLYQLREHDFWMGVCFNHDPPRFGSRPWCAPVHDESRPLEEWELKEIMRRYNALKRRLNVVSTPKEIIAVVHCFSSGGWIPEIDERITGKEGEHL